MLTANPEDVVAAAPVPEPDVEPPPMLPELWPLETLVERNRNASLLGVVVLNVAGDVVGEACCCAVELTLTEPVLDGRKLGVTVAVPVYPAQPGRVVAGGARPPPQSRKAQISPVSWMYQIRVPYSCP
jgi:hypothetical protein